MALESIVSKRNEECFLGGGSKGGRFAGLTKLPPSCADCHGIWEFHAPGNLRACPRIALYLRRVWYIRAKLKML